MRENVPPQLDRQKELVSMTASMNVLSLNSTTEIDEVPNICFQNIRENGNVQINIYVDWNTPL
jgi:outer membrane PBP1 activator LpoA protein